MAAALQWGLGVVLVVAATAWRQHGSSSAAEAAVVAAQQRDGSGSLSGAWRLWQLGGGAVAAVVAASNAGREAGRVQRRQCGGSIWVSIIVVCVSIPGVVVSRQDRRLVVTTLLFLSPVLSSSMPPPPLPPPSCSMRPSVDCFRIRRPWQVANAAAAPPPLAFNAEGRPPTVKVVPAAAAAEQKPLSGSGSSGEGWCPCRDRVVVPVAGVIIINATTLASPPPPCIQCCPTVDCCCDRRPRRVVVNAASTASPHLALNASRTSPPL